MLLKQILEFGLGYVTDLVDNDLAETAIRLVVPQLMELADIEQFDAQARAQVQAKIDDVLREARLI